MFFRRGKGVVVEKGPALLLDLLYEGLEGWCPIKNEVEWYTQVDIGVHRGQEWDALVLDGQVGNLSAGSGIMV